MDSKSCKEMQCSFGAWSNVVIGETIGGTGGGPYAVALALPDLRYENISDKAIHAGQAGRKRDRTILPYVGE